ncbi:MAG: hypothetical protein ACOVOQ_07085 [Flavobacterium sp.]|jgi:hypothetical protein
MIKKNILYGDIVVIDGKKEKTLKEVVFTEGDTIYKKMIIKKILTFKIVGQTNISKSYTEVKASDEKRNNITGAYE